MTFGARIESARRRARPERLRPTVRQARVSALHGRRYSRTGRAAASRVRRHTRPTRAAVSAGLGSRRQLSRRVVMAKINRQWILKKRPVGDIRPGDLEFVETPMPVPGPGEFLARTLYLSLDPTNRIWMSDMDQYMPPVQHRRRHARRHGFRRRAVEQSRFQAGRYRVRLHRLAGTCRAERRRRNCRKAACRPPPS